VALCSWLVIVSLWNAPNHLSYFNEIAGGPEKGHEFLCDSNVDWGQGLIELKAWLSDHPEAAANLHLAYFGSIDPAWVGVKFQLPPRSSAPGISVPLVAQDMLGPIPGWYIVSKNYLAGHSMPVPDGVGRMHFRYFDSAFCDYFNDFEPVDVIGGTLMVYKLELQEVNSVRSRQGLALIVPAQISHPSPSKSLQDSAAELTSVVSPK